MFIDSYIVGLVFLRLRVTNTYVWRLVILTFCGLVFLLFGVSDSYVYGVSVSYVFGVSKS